MRKIREVLRLRLEAGLSARQVAASLQMARSSVKDYERRLAAAGLGWPLPARAERCRTGAALVPAPATGAAAGRACSAGLVGAPTWSCGARA